MSAPSPRRLNRRIATLALLALLWAQALVLGHAVAHAGWPPLQASMAPTTGEHMPASGHTVGTAHCLLLDHLLLGQAPGSVYPAQAQHAPRAAPPAQPPATPATGATWRRYHARGPPQS